MKYKIARKKCLGYVLVCFSILSILLYSDASLAESVDFHYFYRSEMTGLPVYLSGKLSDASWLDIKKQASFQSQREQLKPNERLLVVKHSNGQNLSLRPSGLKLYSKGLLPDRMTCHLSWPTDLQLKENPEDSYELHRLPAAINPACSQFLTNTGETIPFTPIGRDNSGLYPDGLLLLEVPPPKPPAHNHGGVDLPNRPEPGSLWAILSGSYGGGPDHRFDFRPGGGSSPIDISVALSFLPTARETLKGGQPVLTPEVQQGISISLTDSGGQQWQQFYTLDQARALLEGVEDGDELLGRLRGASLNVKAEVIADLSQMCRESLEAIGQRLQTARVISAQAVPIISCPRGGNLNTNAASDNNKATSSSKGGKPRVHSGFTHSGDGVSDDKQGGSDSPPPPEYPGSNVAVEADDTDLWVDRLVEASAIGDVRQVRDILDNKGSFLLFRLHRHNGDSALHAAVRYEQDAVCLEIENHCDCSPVNDLWQLKNSKGETPSQLKVISYRKKLLETIRDSWPMCGFCKKISVIPYQNLCGCTTCKTCMNQIQVEKICQNCNADISESDPFLDAGSLREVLVQIKPLLKLCRLKEQCSSCKEIAFPVLQGSCGDSYCPMCYVKVFERPKSLVCRTCGQSIQWVMVDKGSWEAVCKSGIPMSDLSNNGFIMGQQDNPGSIEPEILAVAKTAHKQQPGKPSKAAELPERLAITRDPALTENWLKVLDTWHKRGVFVRMLSDYMQTKAEVRVEQLIYGSISSGTLLLAGVPSRLFDCSYGGAGLVFQPDFEVVGLFKENAFSLDPSNCHDGLLDYNSLHDPYSGEAFKNHLNLYSLVMKMREQTLWNDFKRTKSSSILIGVDKISSGHIDMHGDFTRKSDHVNIDGCLLCKSKKLLTRKEDTSVSMNEVIVHMRGSLSKILALVIQAPVTKEKINLAKRIIKKISELDKDNTNYKTLPVVLYESGSYRMTLLGGIESLMQLEPEADYEKLHSLLAEPALCHDLFDVFHHWKPYAKNSVKQYQALQTIRYVNALLYKKPFQTNSYPFLKTLDVLPMEAEDWKAEFKKYRRNLNNSPIIDYLLNYGLFSDNLQRFIENAPVLDPDLKGSSHKDFFTAVFFSVACRQLLENLGVDFTDEEALLLPFAVITAMGKESSKLFANFQQIMRDSGVPHTLISDMEKAVTTFLCKNTAEYIGERAGLYRYILTSSILLFDCIPIPEHLYSVADPKKIEKLKLQLSTLTEFIPSIREMKTLSLSKGNTWSSMLSELQHLFKERVVRELDKHSLITQPWPYSELSVSVPSEMTLIDLLFALTDQDELSLYISVLVEHYQQHGFPCYLGTIRSGYVNDKVASTIAKELLKHPPSELLKSIESSFKVKKRYWEMPHETPESKLSPDQGLKEAMMQSSTVSPYLKGSTEFKGITKPFPKFATRPVCRSDLEPGDSCSICLESLLSTEKERVKLECNHIFHAECMERVLQTKLTCPVCRSFLTPFITGQQPEGDMHWGSLYSSLRMIWINYITPAGTFNGRSYPRDKRTAFLPDTQKGRIALKMLKAAFERGLVLTVGHSISRNLDHVVTWNDIPHKTSLYGGAEYHGYPDDGYLPRLIEILKGLGIKEEDDDR